MINPKIFKDYDIRATIGETLDAEGMYQLGLALTAHFQPTTIGICRDMRLSSPEFFQQLSKAFLDSGVSVIDYGMTTTDMSYFASANDNIDLSLMITASHNPGKDNGLKITTKGAIPVGGDTGLYAVRDLLPTVSAPSPDHPKGTLTQADLWERWITHTLKFCDLQSLKPFRVLVDAGNGMGGQITERIAKYLPLQITPMYFEPDGNFPNHLANPLLMDNTAELRRRVVAEHFDFGVAWDGDADRVYLIDDQGNFVNGTELGSMLADYLLSKNPGDKVIYNAVMGRVVNETILKHRGIPIRWRVGHALLKAKMREENALLAVEHSGHFFFRDNYYCDSGIVALLTSLEIISKLQVPLSQHLAQYRQYPSSGEINFAVNDKTQTMQQLEKIYQKEAQSIDWLDGVTVWFKDWWFNVRPSNTQPLLRLNLEVNSSSLDLKSQVAQVVQHIEDLGGHRVEE